MKKFTFFASLVAVSLLGSVAQAQIIDGIRDAVYGPAFTIQDTFTDFGDSNTGTPNAANGSELNAAYITVSGGLLNILLTGNLESNNNRIYIFFDTGSGGQNTLGGLPGGPGGFDELNGLRFDIGFNATHGLRADGTGSDTFFNFTDLTAGTFLGRSTPGSGNGFLTTGTANGVSAVIDNSNTIGVTTASGTGGENATTGLELQIPLSLIGNPGGTLRITAFVTGGSFVSNQVLGGIGGGGNLGSAATVDFSAIAGDQFFTAIPEPSSLSLLAGPALLGAFLFVRRRRR